MSRGGDLLAIAPDGTTTVVPNTFEGIKAGLDGAILDFLRPHKGVGFYVDDEAMLTNQPLNMVVSMMSGMAIYGHAVLVHPDVDAEGDTIAPDPDNVALAQMLAMMWKRMQADAERKGQSLALYPEPGRLPPPQFVQFNSDDEMFRYLFGPPEAADE